MEISERELRVYAEDCVNEGAVCYGKNGCKNQLVSVENTHLFQIRVIATPLTTLLDQVTTTLVVKLFHPFFCSRVK